MLLHVLLSGMKKRRRDTLALGGVLFLSFFFLTLCALLFSSITLSEQRARQQLYGTWQALHYGARNDVQQQYGSIARDAMGACILCGETASGQLIATLDGAALEKTGFELLEGRLPENEDEIVLVQGAWENAAVGDAISVQHVYDYMAVAQDDQGDALLYQEVLRALEPQWDAHCAAFERELSAYEAQTGQKESALSPEEYNRLLVYFYALRQPAYKISSVRANDNLLIDFNGLSLTVRSHFNRTTLMGDGYGARQGANIDTQRVNECLVIYKQYTVAGIVRQYADRWDVLGYAMPDAFVAPEAAQSLEAAVDFAQQRYYPQAPAYQRRSILFFRDDALTTHPLCDRLLPVYQASAGAGYRVEALAYEDTRFSGYLVGRDPQSGQDVYCPFQGEGSIGSVVIQGVSYAFSLPELLDGRFLADGLEPYAQQTLTAAQLEANNVHALRLNTFAYPSAAAAGPALWTILRAALVLLTACATFQIFWAQLKRRRTRLVTLLSIGAEDSQIIAMLLGELLTMLLAALPLGVLLGSAAAWLLARTVLDAAFYVQPGLLAAGLLLGAAAALLGAAAPVLLAVRAPLTGREPVRTMQARRRGRELPAAVLRRRRGYGFIAVRHLTMNRGRSALGLLFAFLLCTVLVLTVFLSFNAQNRYQKQVVYAGKPDYQISAPYALSPAYLNAVLDRMPETPASLSYLRASENVYLHCGALLAPGGSPILRALNSHPQGGAFFRTLSDGTQALRTLSPDADKLSRLSFDQKLAQLLDVTYDGLYRDDYQRDLGVVPGDTLTYTAFSQKIDPVTNALTQSETVVRCRVAAVVYYFPQQAIWPFSGDAMTHIAISGTRLCAALYPNSGTRMNPAATKGFWVMSRLFYPDCYGKTYLYLSGAGQTDSDGAYARFADALGFSIANYRTTGEALRTDAMKNAAMALLLGAAATLILLTILSSTASSQLEQDCRRTGILQGIGASGAQLLWGQCLQGLLTALAALALAHLLLGAAVAVYGVCSVPGAFDPAIAAANMRALLRGYPWTAHLSLCAACVAVYVFLSARALIAICQREPIDNIRG